MNRRLLEIIKRIQNGSTITELAEKCKIHPTKLQSILLGKTKEKLTKEEIMRIWENYQYKFSLNEMLQIFNYEYSDKIVRGEIYWVDFGDGKGSIQGNVRPAVITSNDKNNKFSPTVNVAPITSSINKKNIPSHVQIEGCGLEKISTILTEQTRTVNKTDLKGFIGYCDTNTLNKLNNAINIQFDTNTSREFSMDSFLKYFVSKHKLKDPARLSNALMKEYNTFCQLV